MLMNHIDIIYYFFIVIDIGTMYFYIYTKSIYLPNAFTLRTLIL